MTKTQGKVINRVVNGKGPLQRYSEFLADLRSELSVGGWVSIKAIDITTIHAIDNSIMVFLVDMGVIESRPDPNKASRTKVFRATEKLASYDAKQLLKDIGPWRLKRYQDSAGIKFGNRKRLAAIEPVPPLVGDESAALNEINQIRSVIDFFSPADNTPPRRAIPVESIIVTPDATEVSTEPLADPVSEPVSEPEPAKRYFLLTKGNEVMGGFHSEEDAESFIEGSAKPNELWVLSELINTYETKLTLNKSR